MDCAFGLRNASKLLHDRTSGSPLKTRAVLQLRAVPLRRRPTPPRLQSVYRLDRARCFSLNDVHSRRDHERAQGRRPANIKAMAATGRNGVSNADERTRRARSARPSADKCITFRINGRSADELRLAQVRMPTGAGAKMILQVHLPRDGPAHGRVGHPILRCAGRPACAVDSASSVFAGRAAHLEEVTR